MPVRNANFASHIHNTEYNATFQVKNQAHILVIDDNTGVLVALNMLLRRHFERVTLLNSPQWIEETLSKQRPSAIILDMNFNDSTNSGREGLDILRKIHALAPEIPVLLLTAYADINLAVTGIKEGASDFIAKPWDNDKLIMALMNALDATHTVEPDTPRPSTLAEMECQMIENALTTHGGNLTAVAKELGITRQTLYNKMKKMGL